MKRSFYEGTYSALSFELLIFLQYFFSKENLMEPTPLPLDEGQSTDIHNSNC
jgi:hypothetical protein